MRRGNRWVRYMKVCGCLKESQGGEGMNGLRDRNIV